MTRRLLAPAPLAFLLLALLPANRAFAQADPVAALPGSTVERLTEDIRTLAADAFEGRGVETEGIELAAEYVRSQMEAAGLKPAAADGSFFQPFDIALGRQVDRADSSLTLTGPDGGTRALALGGDFTPLEYGGGGTVTGELVLAGYGITAPRVRYDDFAGLDVTGKIVVVLRREPRRADPASPFAGEQTSRYSFIRTKLKAATDAGAAAVLLVNDADTVAEEGDVLSEPRTFGPQAFEVPFGQLTRAGLDALLARSPLTIPGGLTLTSADAVEKTIDAGLTPIGGPLGVTAELSFAFLTDTAKAKNVVGLVEGVGPLAGETVIFGAHYDHVGFGGLGSRRPGSNEVHNGADDNASGTALLLELARRSAARAAAGDPPARRLLFVAFSGEERGLLGSKHYVKNPLFSLAATRAMLNFDMVGRYGENAFQLHGVGSSPGLPALVDAAAAGTGVVVSRVDGVNDASDHFPFIRADVPAFHFFTGLTPQYHLPEDDVETLNLPGVAELTEFADRLADSIISGTDPLPFVKPATARLDGRKRSAGRPLLGVVPADLPPAGGGVAVELVPAGGPAAAAGVEPGDVILSVAGAPVGDAAGLSAALSAAKPGQTVEVTVRRGAGENAADRTLTVTLGAAR